MLPIKDAQRPNAGPAEPAAGRAPESTRQATPSGSGSAPVTANQRPAQGHGAGHGHHGQHGHGSAPARREAPREARASGSPNIQDVFLNYARREKLTVVIQLLDGQSVEGRIKNFDRFALIIDHGGVDHLVFKHAIATIRSPRSIGSYYASHEAS
jgi:host factor-I protein